MESLVQPLFDGSIDIVGDVHGEIEALRELLRHLSYDESGRHPNNRRLVFVGDLTDRGPDSPAVADLVQSLVEAGRAQCVLGNHDLNILLEKPKHDNDWFFGRKFFDNGYLVPQVLADTAVQERVLAFFRTLPLALEREDVRVVHACWLPSMVEFARAATSVVDLYDEHQRIIDSALARVPGPDDVYRQLQRQNLNPVKVLTSGLERRAEVPVEASGKLRFEERVEWWHGYRDAPTCVFGHYSIANGGLRGAGRAFCVDYAVAKRWTERRDRLPISWTKLAAFRLPERRIVFDDGTQSTPTRGD